MRVVLQKSAAVLSALTLSFLLTACSSAPVKDKESQAVPEYIKSPILVKDAILTSGKKLGWIFKELDSNTLEGSLFTPKYVYRVLIPYSGEEYSLLFISMDKLRYDDGETKTFRRDDNWMVEFNEAIQNKLKDL